PPARYRVGLAYGPHLRPGRLHAGYAAGSAAGRQAGAQAPHFMDAGRGGRVPGRGGPGPYVCAAGGGERAHWHLLVGAAAAAAHGGYAGPRGRPRPHCGPHHERATHRYSALAHPERLRGCAPGLAHSV
nr:hypothetical protein [Tanacetum cinerariifolium]